MRYAALVSSLICLSLWGQSVIRRTPAGKDAEGNQLTVVQQHFRKREPSDKSCIPGEKFVLEKTRGGRVASSEEVIAFCQSEDEAETSVTVAPNAIKVDRNGGSHAGYFNISTYQLSPWKALEVDACSFSAGSTEFTVEHWDYARLRGQAWTGSAKTAGGICVQEPEVFTYMVVPELPFDVERLEKSRNRLGSCALSMDASGRNGFVIWGKPDAKDPVEVKLLFTGHHTLLAQVIDPQRNTRPAASWVNADHFEIWMGAQGELGGADSMWQFGIPLDEAPVQVGFGKPPKLPAVRRWSANLPDGRTAILLRIDLPPYPSEFSDGLTVVYSQSLEGRTQKRMISTSRIKRGDPETIGSQDSVVRHMEYTQCDLVQGSLEMSGGPKKPLEVPLPVGGLVDPAAPAK